MSEDLYSIVGVSRTATPAEIKKAYRGLARQLHPDRNPDNPAAEDRFKRVSYAYEVLRDTDKRKLYDEFGEVGLKEGFDPEQYRQYQAWQGGGRGPQDPFRRGGGRTNGVFNLEDLFGRHGQGGQRLEDLFGLDGMGGGRAAPRRGADLSSEIHLSLLDAIRGGERELGFAPPGGATKSVKVRIPSGARDGDKVRLRGQGGPPGPGGNEPGDLVLELRVASHPFLRREGDDLHMELPVTLLEAYRGARVEVPTLDGRVTLTVPAGSQPSAKLRLRGKGVRRGKKVGDMYFHVQPQLPPAENTEVESALEGLESHYEDVRKALVL